jgi:hypothetical protein
VIRSELVCLQGVLELAVAACSCLCRLTAQKAFALQKVLLAACDVALGHSFTTVLADQLAVLL